MSNNISRVTCHVDTLWFFTYILYWTCFLASVPVECFMIHYSQIRHMWQVAYNNCIRSLKHLMVENEAMCFLCWRLRTLSRSHIICVEHMFVRRRLSIHQLCRSRFPESHVVSTRPGASHIDCVAHDFLHRCLWNVSWSTTCPFVINDGLLLDINHVHHVSKPFRIRVCATNDSSLVHQNMRHGLCDFTIMLHITLCYLSFLLWMHCVWRLEFLENHIILSFSLFVVTREFSTTLNFGSCDKWCLY